MAWCKVEHPPVTPVGTTAEGWAGFLELMWGDTLEGPKARAFWRETLCLSQHGFLGSFYSFLSRAPGKAKWNTKKSYVPNIFLWQNLCPYFFPKVKHQGWLQCKQISGLWPGEGEDTWCRQRQLTTSGIWFASGETLDKSLRCSHLCLLIQWEKTFVAHSSVMKKLQDNAHEGLSPGHDLSWVLNHTTVISFCSMGQ